VIDDERVVRSVSERYLGRYGFEVLMAEDGRRGIDVFRRHVDDIVCVVLDLTMPEMNGDEVFRELRAIRPDVRVVLSSGYNQQDVTQRFAGKGLAGFIQKPYSAEQLISVIRHIVAD
jgi:CheY-like chemotaxis protein